MSVATEFPPDVYIPPPARAGAEQTAIVLPFRPRRLALAPDDPGSLRDAARQTVRTYGVRPAVRPASVVRVAAAPLRLTRRGYLVAGLLAAALAAGLLWLARASAPAAPPASNAPVVTVREGDTLWSIATRVAPRRDPRTVVTALERINHLPGPVLRPGQVLRTR